MNTESPDFGKKFLDEFGLLKHDLFSGIHMKNSGNKKDKYLTLGIRKQLEEQRGPKIANTQKP